MKQSGNFTEIFTNLFDNTNLSMHAFSKKANLKHSQIAKYLSGEYPTLYTAIKICDYFNCSLDYLVGISNKYSYDNLVKGYDKSVFFKNYQELLKSNNTTHFALSKKGIVCETRLSSYKLGTLPSFPVLIDIAFELGGSLDKMLGRI